MNIEYKENIDEEVYKIIDEEFNKYAIKNDVVCNYQSFAFVEKEENKVMGIITGHSYYKEVHIEDLVVFEEYRNKHIGSKLVEEVEKNFAKKDLKILI